MAFILRGPFFVIQKESQRCTFGQSVGNAPTRCFLKDKKRCLLCVYVLQEKRVAKNLIY
jgi:hypothetical protein